MSRLVSAAELAARVGRPEERVREWLDEWVERGIADEVEPGLFRLTGKGREIAKGLVEVSRGMGKWAA